MIQTHKFLHDVDLGVDDDVLKEDHIIGVCIADNLVEFADFNDVDLALLGVEAGDGVFVAQETLPVECVVDAVVGSQGLEDRDVLWLCDHVNAAGVRQQ